MPEYGFVPLRFLTRERLLLPTDGPVLAPTTGSVINGSVIRGILAQACRGDQDLLQELIISGDVAAAPGFPVLTVDGSEMPAYPAPRVLLRVTETDDAVDARTDPGDRDTESVRGLVAFDALEWHPAQVAVRTDIRLQRPRIGGAQEGLGPIAFTTLDPQQVFEARLRVRGGQMRRQRLRALLHEVLDTASTGQPLSFGSGAEGSYGGDAEVRVGALTGEPDPWPVEDVAGGCDTALILRAPALVAHPTTGECDPAALGENLGRLLEELEIPARVGAVSTQGVRVGGGHTGYGRMRPPQWAAAPGSVVTVHTTGDVSTRDWHRLLCHRVGSRTVDGLGILGLLPAFENTRIGEPVSCLHQPRHGFRLLPTGAPATPVRVAQPHSAVSQQVSTAPDLATQQLVSVQLALLTAAADRWARETAVAVVAEMPQARNLGVSVLSRLRSKLHDRTELAKDLAPAPADTKTPPWTAKLERCRVGATDLRQWLRAAADPAQADAAWDALCPEPQSRDFRKPDYRQTWQTATRMVMLTDEPADEAAALEVSALRREAIWTLARQVVLTLQHAAGEVEQ